MTFLGKVPVQSSLCEAGGAAVSNPRCSETLRDVLYCLHNRWQTLGAIVLGQDSVSCPKSPGDKFYRSFLFINKCTFYIVGARYLDSDRTGPKKIFFMWIISFSTQKIFFSVQFDLNPDISPPQYPCALWGTNGDKRNYMTLQGEVQRLWALQFC